MPDSNTADQARASDSGIARGLRVIGDITGTHDLLIEGEVNGSVFLPKNKVRIGPTAEVSANITARLIEVEGKVVGDLTAAERVVVTSSSRLDGDIVAPQIQLKEGCQFRGAVQMREPDMGRKPPTKSREDGAPGSGSAPSTPAGE